MSKPEDKLFPDLKKAVTPAPTVELPAEFAGKTSAEIAAIAVAERAERKKFETEMTGKFEGLTRTILENAPTRLEPAVLEEVAPNPRVDPEGYYNFLHNKNVKPLANEAFARFAELERDRARARFKDFDKYEKEVDAMISGLPLELRAKRGSYETAYRLAKSEKLETEEREAAARGDAGFTETPSTPSRPAPVTRREFSDQEKMVMKEFGMKEDEYVQFHGMKEIA